MIIATTVGAITNLPRTDGEITLTAFEKSVLRSRGLTNPVVIEESECNYQTNECGYALYNGTNRVKIWVYVRTIAINPINSQNLTNNQLIALRNNGLEKELKELVKQLTTQNSYNRTRKLGDGTITIK